MRKAEMEITKEISFEAAHFLHNPKWDRAGNLRAFQKCSGFRADNPEVCEYPHGHSYRLRVTVLGKVDSDTGFVIDFKILKDILTKEVYDRFDHRFINKEVEPFKSRPEMLITVENLLQEIWKLLEPPIRRQKIVLKELTLWESTTNSATYRGGKGPA
jgi:6-pyruvoyltetrahydropterin/6-carboxytetrahydropterin synthase